MTEPTYFNVVYTADKGKVYRVTYTVSENKITKVERRKYSCPEYVELDVSEWHVLTKRILTTAGNGKAFITSDWFYIPRNLYTTMTDEEVLMMDTREDFRQYLEYQRL